MMRAIDMKPIMTVYPSFQALPKGLKQLLVESESFFFEEETTFFRRNHNGVVSRGRPVNHLPAVQLVSKSRKTRCDFTPIPW